MISAGNDIVSLAHTDKVRTERPAFYKRILSPTEIERYEQGYHQSMPLHHYVWLSWSAKEAAFKFLQRHHPHLVFSPTKFTVINLTPPTEEPSVTVVKELNDRIFDTDKGYHGRILHDKHTLYFRSFSSQEVIHTLVSNDQSFNNIRWGLLLTDDDSPAGLSAAVREAATERLHTLYGQSAVITKDERGIPLISSSGIDSTEPISLSHHGQYVGYVFNNR
ncbi:4'-phosphopantetheinyl transferase superfamily protein [Mucilaginibacter daejeonensis]|uniref:4'-phosphopantetheinyl transferase superfamily protein n=1 Tax=Mucilaginibacter daejeonensis TaxID=398049 RepID=UPI001D172F1F|nr:4'-phosphopantetheinyl transferase superfamily protein [Mucilaginibacter daejeonensis]UEG52748.1 4'-phosphopantetheinyl transferase superfamily protein [Mucilaginibacter daejeonensis]